MDVPRDPCPSTHGGSGYAPGTYWDGDALVCGICGARIERPAPTGSQLVYDKRTWKDRLLLRWPSHYEPRYPDWIGKAKA